MTIDLEKCRADYVRGASAIERATGASKAAIKARASRLAHELADGEDVDAYHFCQAINEMVWLVARPYENAEHHASGERERRALAIWTRELAKPVAAAPKARTTRETPPAYVPPTPAPVAPPASVSNVVALFGRAMRGAPPVAPPAVEVAPPADVDPEWAAMWGRRAV